MILEVIIIILILIVAVLILAIYSEINKLEKTEVEEFKYYNYQEKFKQIEYSTLQLKKIDEKGTFEGDDEIGWFFKHILEIQNKLEKFKIK